MPIPSNTPSTRCRGDAVISEREGPDERGFEPHIPWSRPGSHGPRQRPFSTGPAHGPRARFPTDGAHDPGTWATIPPDVKRKGHNT